MRGSLIEAAATRMSICSMVLLGLQILPSAACSHLRNPHIHAENAYANSQQSTPTPTSPRVAISGLIRSLDSSDELVRVRAESELLKLAHESSEGRKMVVDEIVTSIHEKAELNGTHSVLSPLMFEYWESVTT